MDNLYKNKYRISTVRLQNWDYGWNAAYFVTICTKNRIFYFGDIVIETQNIVSPQSQQNIMSPQLQQKMQLSKIGTIANNCWHEIPKHFPFVKLGAFVIMPNHVHGIVIIDKSVQTQNIASPQQNNVSPQLQKNITPPKMSKNKFGPQSQNLASIIRGFKIGVTKQGRQINPDFAWQSSYHEHIIRNEKSFHNISEYIVNNALNWKGDKFFKP